MAGGLVEREWECTSLRKGLAGDGARFSLFFSSCWFCGLVSLPEPLELSILQQRRRRELDDGGKRPIHRAAHDPRRAPAGKNRWVPRSSSSSGGRFASCAALRASAVSRQSSRAPCPESPWRKRCNMKGDHRDGRMTDRLHLQPRRKLEGDASAHDPSSSSADPVSILPSRRAASSSPAPRPSVLSPLSDVRSANGAASRSTPVISCGAHAPPPPRQTSAPLVVFGTRFRYLRCACAPHDSIHKHRTRELCSEIYISCCF